MSQIFIILASVIHVLIFIMESLLWGRPEINRMFGTTSLQAEQNRLFAFNQGFYNLFLAMAAIVGVILDLKGEELIGKTLMIYAALSMLGAACVLLYSNPKLIRAALIQGAPPLLALCFGYYL